LLRELVQSSSSKLFQNRQNESDQPALTLLSERGWSRWHPEDTSDLNSPFNTDWIEVDCSLHLPVQELLGYQRNWNKFKTKERKFFIELRAMG